MEGDDFDVIDQALQRAQRRGLSSKLLEDFKKQRASRGLEYVFQFQASDIAAMEEAMREAEQQGVCKEVLARCSKQLDEERAKQEEQRRLEDALREAERRRAAFLARLQSLPEGSVLAIKAAIKEGEELGMEVELAVLREKLEKELSRRMEKAKEERAKCEKLAKEFKDAKEAQDFGGGVLVAQWRAAVAEIAKPLVISEDD